MTETIGVPAGRLADENILGHDRFEARRVQLGEIRNVVVGGITFGRPVIHGRFAAAGRVAVVIQFPFDLDELGRHSREHYLRVRYHAELTTPGAVAVDVWPKRADTAGVTVFGLDDGLRLGVLPSRLAFHYEAPPSGVEGTATGPRVSWSIGTPDGSTPIAATHRLVAVVSLPSDTIAVEGTLTVEAEVGDRRPGRAQQTSSRRDREFSIPLVAPSAFETTVLPEQPTAHVPTRGRPAATPPPADPRPEYVVSTGITEAGRTDEPSPADLRPQPNTRYDYWFTIGPKRDPLALPEWDDPFVPPPDFGAGTVLTVALFGFDGEVVLDERADTGELVVDDAGAIGVLRQPGGGSGGRRLVFPIHTPERPGRHRFRCNLYCRQTLLQSRLVEMDVAGTSSETSAPSVRSTTDYILDSHVQPDALRDIRPLTLSVLLNDNGDGTHGFRFLGRGGGELVKTDVTLLATTLQDAVDRARAALQTVSWTGGGEWNAAKEFRYVGRQEADLAEDLIWLARVGHRLWSVLTGPLAHELPIDAQELRAPKRILRDLMRSPGTVEIASKYGAAQVVPAALLYDYRLDADLAALTICPAAMRAIAAERVLADEPCFQGDCPNARSDVVCPGGFWGFRHRIGQPQSMRPGTAAEPPRGPSSSGVAAIRFSERPRCVVGASTEFAGRHTDAVSELGDDASRPVITDRAVLLDVLRRASAPHLVYLFCHGIVSNGVAAIRVGPAGSDVISSTTIGDDQTYWPDTRPLVVLNGCRTAAIEPRFSMNFVDAFVRDAHAAGLVGTEVTIVEWLGETFGELFVAAWFRAGTGVGDALRQARLDLMSRGNPLGLVYVAYAAPELRLERDG